MGRVERTREIARRRKRKQKIKKIRAKYAAATSDEEREELLAKARKISPLFTFEETAQG